MTANPKFLIVGPDPRLPTELAAALSGVTDLDPVTHTAAEYRQGIEAARSWRPDLAVVEMTRDLRGLKVFSEEVNRCSPETVVAAVFAPDVFGPDVSESAILIEAMRAGVRDFLRRPLSSADLEGLLERFLRRSTVSAAKLGTVISFLSNKGGVGKSTLAVNLACGLGQRHPQRVLLVDGSLQMGVCAGMLDLKPATSITDAVRERSRLDEVLLRQLATPHESGVELLAAPANALEAAEVDDEGMALILTLGRRAYDYVIVDSFPMLDRVMIAVYDLSDRGYIVLESVVPTILGAAKLIEVLDGLRFPRNRQGIILNRFSNFAGNLKPADVATRLGREIDFVFPYEKRLLIAANLGKPYVLGSSRWFNPFAGALRDMIDEVEAFRSADTKRNRSRVAPSANGEREKKAVKP